MRGIPGNGFYLSSGSESHKSDMSPLFRSRTRKEYIDKGKQGIQRSYRKPELEYTVGVFLFKTGKKREASQQIVFIP